MCPWVLRAHFNEDQVPRLIAEGTLLEDPEPGAPPNPLARLPNGTLSHTVWIKTPAGQVVYRTHGYICPHGDLLGPTGFLDPKLMVTPTARVLVDHRHGDNVTCPDCGTWKPRAQAALRALRPYARRCQVCP